MVHSSKLRIFYGVMFLVLHQQIRIQASTTVDTLFIISDTTQLPIETKNLMLYQIKDSGKQTENIYESFRDSFLLYTSFMESYNKKEDVWIKLIVSNASLRYNQMSLVLPNDNVDIYLNDSLRLVKLKPITSFINYQTKREKDLLVFKLNFTHYETKEI